MEEHAVVGDGAAEAIMIGPVITRIHGQVAAVFRVPAEREFHQGVGCRAGEVSTGVVTGSENVVNRLFDDVDLFAGRVQLVAALVIPAIAPEHGEVAVGGLVVVIALDHSCC